MQPIDAGDLIAQSSEAIEGIKTAAGFRDIHFQHLCMPVIRSFALRVQQLPFSKESFSEVRGAWILGLTASTVALRYAETQLFFPRLESEERRKIEPQCRFAAFAAVLASVVALQAQNAVVSRDSAREDDYHPLVSPGHLHTFLSANPDAKMTWREGHVLSATEAAAVAALFLPPGLLAQFDLRIAQMLFGAMVLPSASGLESTLAKVVRVSIGKVIERDMRTRAVRVASGEASAPDMSTAKEVGDALMATMNPRDLTNPLEATTPFTTPPSANLEHRQSGGFQAVAPPAGIASTEQVGATKDSLLKEAHPVLRDWFEALRTHERYPTLKTHLVTTDRGTEVPINMLGFFGVSGPSIRKMMTDAGMVIDRSADHRAIILHPALNELLFGD